MNSQVLEKVVSPIEVDSPGGSPSPLSGGGDGFRSN